MPIHFFRDVSIVHRDSRLHTGSALHLLLLTAMAGVVGCSGDSTGPAPVKTSQVYWALQLNYHAINMASIAPYNVVRLSATPKNATGDSLSSSGQVVYSSSDPSVLTVDATGLVTAHKPTQGATVSIVASLQDVALNATHADTALVQVTDTIPQSPLATFSMQPQPSDSAKRSVDWTENGFAQGGGSFPWPAHAADAAGRTLCEPTICNINVYYTSTNSQTAAIDRSTGEVRSIDTGHTIFVASTWAYGVAKHDSVAFAIGYRLSYAVTIGLSDESGVTTLGFVAPKRLVMGVGAKVAFGCSPTFIPSCDHPVDVVFDNPASIDSGSYLYFGFFDVPANGRGNISAFGGDSLESFADLPSLLRVRRFPTAGVYRYHSTLFPSDTNEIEIKLIQ